MNNRNNEGRGDYGSRQQDLQEHNQAQDRQRERAQRSQQYGSQQYGSQQNQYSDYGPTDQPGTRAARGQQGGRSGGEYYGGAQFNERAQGWDEDGGSEWSYEGGPERFSASGYSEGNLRASGAYQGDLSQSSRQNVQQYGRQQYGQARGQDYGTARGQYGREQSGFGGGDYYSGRQGFGAQGSYGSEYDTYGRNQGVGEGSGYTRQGSQTPRSRGFAGARSQQGLGSTYGGESSGAGGRGPLYAGQDYLDEGEMSGYRGRRELGTQEVGSNTSGRYGTEPGQYGYGGYGLGSRGYRGVGPKNYTRSDERLMEEINERLTDDDDLDASEITVRVADCKVTLEGTVDQRWMKHRAEDIADACSGVKEVDNRITVTSSSRDLGSSRSASKSASSRTTGSVTGSQGTTGSPTNIPPGSTGTH